jgi:hypothetical protein
VTTTDMDDLLFRRGRPRRHWSTVNRLLSMGK